MTAHANLFFVTPRNYTKWWVYLYGRLVFGMLNYLLCLFGKRIHQYHTIIHLIKYFRLFNVNRLEKICLKYFYIYIFSHFISKLGFHFQIIDNTRKYLASNTTLNTTLIWWTLSWLAKTNTFNVSKNVNKCSCVARSFNSPSKRYL